MSRASQGMVKRQPSSARVQQTRGNHHVQSMLSGARIGRRDSANERDAHARGPQIAEVLGPLAGARPGPGGMQLPAAVSASVGERLGTDVSHVRLHDGHEAAGLSRAANARAFTHGGNVMFGRGQFDPSSRSGRELIAHELVHAASPSPEIQREPDKPTGVVTMEFNGDDLIVFDGGKEKFRFSGHSGRPVLLKPEDAKACSADPITDTYMNDKRFVGVKDFGPIPEGNYTISPSSIQNFDFGDQMKLLFSGHTTTKTDAGTLTGGDWGEGRVPIIPAGGMKQGPCGNTTARSGFFLHGGLLAGSSGCIDIGGDFSTLSDWLKDYKGAIRLTVKYTNTPPTVRGWTGLTGALAYQRFGFGINANLGLGVENQGEANRFLVQPEIDAVLKWAGGALKAGVRLEIPLNDKEQFVRLGLGGGIESRIFGALYAQIFGGYSFALTDEALTGQGPYLGGGLKYDLGPVQLGLVYDHLWTAQKTDPEAHRVLTTLGFWLF